MPLPAAGNIGRDVGATGFHDEGDPMKYLLPLALLAATLPSWAAQPDVLPVKQIGLELARDIAMNAVEACRKDGHNVSAVV
jgi:hypothetical protein